MRTVGKTPGAYGYYELGGADGDLVDHGVDILRDKLKRAPAYGNAECICWECTTPLDHAG